MDGVLIVDDDTPYLDSLVRELRPKFAPVEGVASGEEAVRVVARRPQDFRFAVIDHVLEKGMNGIETTREIVKACPGIYPVVFSNVATDARLMEYKFKALEAGAYRYLEKKGDGPRQISDFVQEMEHLERLRNWVAGFHAVRHHCSFPADAVGHRDGHHRQPLQGLVHEWCHAENHRYSGVHTA